MKSQLIADIDEKTYAVIFSTGDEVVSGLLAFAREKNISAAHFTAIGAFSELTIGYFNWEKKDYEHIPVREQVEVLSLSATSRFRMASRRSTRTASWAAATAAREAAT